VLIMSWPEVATVLKNKRYELVLSGPEINERLKQSSTNTAAGSSSSGELDPEIWKCKQLNFLEITLCPHLKQLPPEIGQLQNLTTLTLTSNSLSSLCPELSELRKLRHFHCSFNQLEVLPEQLMINWLDIETINLNHNKLTGMCSLSGGLQKLAILNLSNNQFKEFPKLSQDLFNLSQIDLSTNQLEEVPSTVVVHLQQLKLLNLDNNQLKQIPAELSKCQKLKELRFKLNPLKDNRLKKLMEQDKLKAVMEYLEKEYFDEQKKLGNAKPEQKKTCSTNSNNNGKISATTTTAKITANCR